MTFLHSKATIFSRTHAVCVSYKSVNWFPSSQMKLNVKILLCPGELSKILGTFMSMLMVRLMLLLFGIP